MQIKLHDDVEGRKSGETVDVPQERAEWYLANGYASKADYNRDEHPEMDVPIAGHPQEAANAGKPNKGLPEQIAEDSLGNLTDPDPDGFVPTTFTSNKHQPERTNSKEPRSVERQMQRAGTGKAKLEAQAASTDPADAPELNPDLVGQRAEAADKVEKAATTKAATGKKA